MQQDLVLKPACVSVHVTKRGEEGEEKTLYSCKCVVKLEYTVCAYNTCCHTLSLE